MHILCIGMNHLTSSVKLRERFAFDEGRRNAALARVGCGYLSSGCLNELVILSTCNRVEIYAATLQVDFTPLESMLSEIHAIPLGDFKPFVYQLADEDAVWHLMSVASGLDSLVIGEPQILGQVAEALAHAQEQNSTGKVLSRLFYSAIRAGKRARSETAISQNAASIPALAVRLAERTLQDITNARIVIMGAGEMAELSVEALRKRGAQQVLVVNRTLERARSLAERWQGEATTFEHLVPAVEKADILIASTSAPHIMLHTPTVEKVMASRPNRPLVVIDIAVPRDVEAEVGQIPNVLLFDMDNLQAGLEQSLDARMREVPRVEAILQEEQSLFLEYLKSLDLLPIIATMRQKAEAIRQQELERTLKRLPDLGEAERARLEAMTLAMVKKILHEPILRLRGEAGGPQAAEYAVIVRSLFGLDDTVGHSQQISNNP